MARLAMPPAAVIGLDGGADVAAHFTTVGSNNVVVEDVQAPSRTHAVRRTARHGPGTWIQD
jgi:hypothetical protein